MDGKTKPIAQLLVNRWKRQSVFIATEACNVITMSCGDRDDWLGTIIVSAVSIWSMTKVGLILAISSILLTGQLSSLPRTQTAMPPLVHLEIGARLKADQILPGLYLLILDC